MTDAARTGILSRLQACSRQDNADLLTEKEGTYLQPYKWTVGENDLLTYFCEKVLQSGATYMLVENRNEVPQCVADYIEQKGLNKKLRLSNPDLKILSWSAQDIAINYGLADSEDELSLVQAYGGIAETGSLVCLSDISVSTSGLFLPQDCMIVVNKEKIVNCQEEIWSMLGNRKALIPRTINLITGPSRTGDIEQTIQIGIHGPRTLHVIIVLDKQHSYSSLCQEQNPIR